jgi:hypothetical protein
MTPPSVRYFLLCEGIEYDLSEPHRVSIHGLVSAIRTQGNFPARHPELWIYLQLTDCRGNGVLQIRIVQADTDRAIFESKQRAVSFGSDPLQIHGLRFCILDLKFGEPGVYDVELWYNENLLDQRPLLVK